ncbi:MAG: Nucleosomal histone H3-Lys79 methylase [Alyxoria varia]|nr:MAG: Nucleosomal histone H3-Lys79 methylase [Alyxoria varia]
MDSSFASFFGKGKADSSSSSKPQPVVRKVRRPVPSKASSAQPTKSKPVPPTPRKAATPKPIQTASRITQNGNRSTSSAPAPDRDLQRPAKSRSNEVRESHKRKSASPAMPVFGSDSEGDSGEDIGAIRGGPLKRAKIGEGDFVDNKRIVRDKKNWSEDGTASSFPLMHGADLTSKEPAGKTLPAFDGDTEDVAEISLQYPSASQRERFQLLTPKVNDGYKPTDDIIETTRAILTHFLPSEISNTCLDSSTGVPFRLTRSLNHKDVATFNSAIDEFNSLVQRSRTEGSIAEVLDEMKKVPLRLVDRILNQVYVRTVSPRVEILRKYQPFSNNTYGELLSPFCSEIFRKTRLDSSSVFLDMGSGVGNVVLQAALETGAESYGIEIQPNACELAGAQASEFPARCRMWGIAPGSVHLLQGDFMDNEELRTILPRADVILVNNQAFDPELNMSLTYLFLDVKEGARIVSLKDFANGKLNERTRDSVVNSLDTRKETYYSTGVSWKSDGGDYFIAVKDSKRILRFMQENERRRG